MKRQSKYTSIKRAFGTCILTCLLFAATPALKAHATDSIDSRDKSATIEYVGKSDDAFMFRIQFANAKNEKFCVTILDSEENVVFEKVYSDQNFDKQFNIIKDAGKLNIVITTLNDYASQKFEIDTNVRLYDNVEISKIDQ